MNRFLTGTAAVMGLLIGGVAQAHDGRGDKKGGSGSSSQLVVNGSGNGQGNRVEIDPKTGEKVTIKNSGNGTGNTVVVAPDPHGKVVINASGNGTGNRIVVEEAPGEHVKIRGSGNGRNNNVVVEKVPGPAGGRPPAKAPAQGQHGGQSHRHR
jgi:hypothetical protein